MAKALTIGAVLSGLLPAIPVVAGNAAPGQQPAELIATADGRDAAMVLEGGDAPTGTELVSIQPEGGQFVDGVPQDPAVISADGRYVAFYAHTPGRPELDLYRRDRTTGTTEPVSVDNNGDWILTSNVVTSDTGMTADGRYVLFRSAFLTEPPDGVPVGRQIFMRDMEAGVTELITIPTADGEPQDPSFLVNGLAISADGRYIGFDTHASNLLPGGAEGRDVYVYDRQTDTLERVSVASDGRAGEGDAPYSRQPAFSADGRFVAFMSNATNLVPDDTNGERDIFVRDREAGTTERVSVASDGTEGNDTSYGGNMSIDISADGRCVGFFSYATNLVPGDTNPLGDVFVHDRDTGSTERVSVASDGGEGNQRSSWVVISANGRYVGFASWATNLVPNDTNGRVDVFVHDRETGSTERVSVASDGGEGNSGSNIPGGISADGRFVTFVSDASNLVPNDFNDVRDIFVRDRVGGPPPSPDRIFDDQFEGQ